MEDEGRPRKQRHTAKRIFERLRDEHGYSGGITIVKDYVLAQRLRHREVFVPLRHDPGHAQVDFGEALAEIAGVECKIHFFAMDLPHSDACFVRAYPAETAEAFCDGHNAAFEFFGKVPRSILYDNTTLAVARILGDGVRQRTRVFSELQSHYVFADRFGRPGKGNDKGKVEGLIGWTRRNLLVPLPRAASLAALNEQLLEGCRRQLEIGCAVTRRRGERLVRDLALFHDLPPAPYDACEKKPGRVSSLSLECPRIQAAVRNRRSEEPDTKPIPVTRPCFVRTRIASASDDEPPRRDDEVSIEAADRDQSDRAPASASAFSTAQAGAI